jgi:hypothetical protein
MSRPPQPEAYERNRPANPLPRSSYHGLRGSCGFLLPPILARGPDILTHALPVSYQITTVIHYPERMFTDSSQYMVLPFTNLATPGKVGLRPCKTLMSQSNN